ncbi:MAG: glycoside hydrolase family 19 protein [Desulfobulbaceae bacterium]|jgi:putative chitinase|nr:glycoside hydrolase family 19 protein [Desulfobulbaceae bacterium]
MTITLEQLKTIMPSAGRRADLYLPHLNAAMDEFAINTPARQSAFLAQICHESGSLLYTSEIASGDAYNYREDLGNARPEAIWIARQNGTTPGQFWKGHGLIQITGFDNHKACGNALDLDLLSFPDLLTQPEYACRSAAWFWQSHGLNELADVGNFERITKRINGGLNGYADRRRALDRASGVLVA